MDKSRSLEMRGLGFLGNMVIPCDLTQKSEVSKESPISLLAYKSLVQYSIETLDPGKGGDGVRKLSRFFCQGLICRF